MRSRYDIENEIKPFIGSDERFEWVDTPSNAPLFTNKDFILVPFGLFFAGFAIFWMYMASNASFIFALFGIPFLLVGIGIAFIRPFLVRRMYQNSSYGLTKSSLIIKTKLLKVQVSTFPLTEISISKMTLSNDGLGTITLRPDTILNQRGMLPTLKNISNPVEVNKTLKEFIKKAKLDQE